MKFNHFLEKWSKSLGRMQIPNRLLYSFSFSWLLVYNWPMCVFLKYQLRTLSLSLQDFEVFRSIDPREYIYKLWNFGPKLTENLRKFSEVWRMCYLAAKLERNTLNRCFGYSFWTSFKPALLSLQIVNKEMFWVVTEICSEPNLVKRMKLIKAFIKIASE